MERQFGLKGQMIFEFIVAAVLFIAIVFYIIMLVNDSMGIYAGGYYRNHLQAEALRVSEQLVANPGVWSGEVPVMPGLASIWPVLNTEKVQWFGDYCNEPDNALVTMLGLEGRAGRPEHIRIELSGASGLIMECGTLPAEGSEGAYVERYAFLSRPVKLGVHVW